MDVIFVAAAIYVYVPIGQPLIKKKTALTLYNRQKNNNLKTIIVERQNGMLNKFSKQFAIFKMGCSEDLACLSD